MKISDLLIKDRINLDVQSTDKTGIIRELAKLHEKTGVLNDYEGYVKALMTREEQSSTGIGEGIAIPHAKTEFVKEPALAMGRKKEGIEYDSLDEENVKIFFMFLCPEEDTQEYLKVLARISRWIKEDRFRESLLKAKTGKEIIDIIKAEEV